MTRPFTVPIPTPGACPDDTAAPQIDKEYLCDGATGTWWLATFVDGVETSLVDTGRSCDTPPPADPETATECRDGTLWTVFYLIDPTAPNTITEIGAVNTGQLCVPACDPAVAYGTATAPPLGDWHQIDTLNGSCCPIQIDTSAGTYTIPAGTAKTVDFDCPVSLISVTAIGATCDPEAIHITGVRRS